MIGPKQAKPTRAEERAAYEAVTERDGGRCVRCGWYGTPQLDHRQNRQTGNTIVPNIQTLCGPHMQGGGMVSGCHHWKGHNVAMAVADGFAVPRWVEVSRIGFWPAWRFDVGSWVVYFDGPDSRGRWWDEITESTAEMLMRGGHE